MSTFIVEDTTINRIISYIDYHNLHSVLGVSAPMSDVEKAEMGASMAKLNSDAVNYRYSENSEPVYQYHYEMPNRDIQAYKTLQCFLYQCAEGNYKEADLFKRLSEVLSRIAEKVISRLPQYERAVWG